METGKSLIPRTSDDFELLLWCHVYAINQVPKEAKLGISIFEDYFWDNTPDGKKSPWLGNHCTAIRYDILRCTEEIEL